MRGFIKPVKIGRARRENKPIDRAILQLKLQFYLLFGGRLQQRGDHLSNHAPRADCQHGFGPFDHHRLARRFDPSAKYAPAFWWIFDLVLLPSQNRVAQSFEMHFAVFMHQRWRSAFAKPGV